MNDEKCRVQERGYRSIPGIFLCPLSAVDCRSFSAFCRLTPTHGVFCRRLFASGCGASLIFSYSPPDAYAWRFFVVSLLLSAAMRRSFLAICRLRPTHGVFRCWIFASGCRASFIFSFLPPDAYARRSLLLAFCFRLPCVVHFQLSAACRLRMVFFVVSLSPSAIARRSFSAFCRLTRTHGVFRRRLFASGCRASFIFSFLPPDAYARRFLSSTFRFRMRCVVHFQLFAACRLRTAFFVVNFSLPAAARRSFSAFCRLRRTHGVFCR